MLGGFRTVVPDSTEPKRLNIPAATDSPNIFTQPMHTSPTAYWTQAPGPPPSILSSPSQSSRRSSSSSSSRTELREAAYIRAERVLENFPARHCIVVPRSKEGSVAPVAQHQLSGCVDSQGERSATVQVYEQMRYPVDAGIEVELDLYVFESGRVAADE